jgi:hypothetical protein
VVGRVQVCLVVRVQVNSFITPSGKKVCSQAMGDRTLIKGKVPYFLASAWNRCDSRYLRARLVAEICGWHSQQTCTVQAEWFIINNLC